MFPKPDQEAPHLNIPLVGGGHWSLDEQNPDYMTMVIFYRGLHCPVCKTYLESLQKFAGDFSKRGVEFIAVSADPEDRAAKAKSEWDIPDVPIGYDFDPREADEWGLFVSDAISEKETALFVEPGLFLIKPDNSIYFGSVQTMPFARPPLGELKSAIDFAKSNDYPARGAYLAA